MIRNLFTNDLHKILVIIYVRNNFQINSPTVVSSKRIRNGESCRIDSLEHVQVRVSFSYVGKRGNVILLLESTTGTKSYLMTPRPLDSVKYPFSGSKVWDFSTVHFWGETLEGVWKLTAKTDNEYNTQGKISKKYPT